MSRIRSVHAREVFDNKGLPTVEVDVALDDGSLGTAAAPGGTSRGSSEPAELRDGDKAYFDGLGVTNAVRMVNTEIANALRGKDALDQESVDGTLLEMDGTSDKSRLGGNTIIATSLANAKAAAASRGVELFQHLGGGVEMPLPCINMLYGGPAYVGVPGVGDFQEYKVILLNATSYRDGYLKALRVFKKLQRKMVEMHNLGIPRLAQLAGTLTARFGSNDEALATLTSMFEAEGFRPRKDFGFYLDLASTQLFKDGKYQITGDNASYTQTQWIDRLEEMCRKYPILSMEDCLHEEDWDGWVEVTKRLGSSVQLVGDDFFTTNPDRLKKGVSLKAANAVVIKPNQVGTLTETFEAVRIAKAAGYGTIVSPRSGEIADPYIAHLCVGQSLGQSKAVGCPVGGPHLNEFLRIEDRLGNRAVFRNKGALAKFL